MKQRRTLAAVVTGLIDAGFTIGELVEWGRASTRSLRIRRVS
jgi:hypothetical protein